MTGTLSINLANSSANTGISVTFTANGVSNANNYTWSVNGTQSLSSNTYNFYVNTSQATNTITVVATDNCGNTQTSTTNLNSSPKAFVYISSDRYLIAGSQCDRYFMQYSSY